MKQMDKKQKFLADKMNMHEDSLRTQKPKTQPLRNTSKKTAENSFFKTYIQILTL